MKMKQLSIVVTLLVLAFMFEARLSNVHAQSSAPPRDGF